MRSTLSQYRPVLWSAFVFAALLGCSGGDKEPSAGTGDGPAGTPLAPQTGQKSALFYGHFNYKKLGSAVDARVINPASPDALLVSSDDIMVHGGGRPPPPTTLVGYNPKDQSYTDLYVSSLYYVKNGSPKRVNMTLGHDMATHTDAMPEEKAHSSATNLSNPTYLEVNYLGTQRILLANDAAGKPVIVCPTASGSEVAIPFADKKFLTFSYDTYGEMPSAGVVFDTSTFKFQKFVPPSEGCEACNEPGTPLSYTDYASDVTLWAGTKWAFIGDIGGTVKSVLIINGKLFILDKAAMTITEKPVTPAGTSVTLSNLASATGKAVYKFAGDSIFYVYKGLDPAPNLYRVDVVRGELTQLTDGIGASQTIPSKIHSVTTDWVLYGTDGLILAAKKDGSKATPKLLAENTRTSGIRYPFNFGIGDDYLFVTYSLAASTAANTFKACVFDAKGETTCRENSFWAAVTAKRQGKLNFTSDYPYTAYAYVRIDDTDDFGGGTLKAVDPVKPLDPGFAVGKVPKYNFNTFLHAHHYLKTTVDTEGAIVIYGKSDETFIGDAFLLNLLAADSVKNLTNDKEPKPSDISGGDLHCHGRYCAVCHAFSGGKIYGDKEGKVETVGYTIRFEFADGSSTLARHGKGMGENFTLPYASLRGDFTPVVVRANDGAEIKRAQKLGHVGLSNSNCNYCHYKNDLRYGAPNVINVAP